MTVGLHGKLHQLHSFYKNKIINQSFHNCISTMNVSSVIIFAENIIYPVSERPNVGIDGGCSGCETAVCEGLETCEDNVPGLRVGAQEGAARVAGAHDGSA